MTYHSNLGQAAQPISPAYFPSAQRPVAYSDSAQRAALFLPASSSMSMVPASTQPSPPPPVYAQTATMEPSGTPAPGPAPGPEYYDEPAAEKPAANGEPNYLLWGGLALLLVAAGGGVYYYTRKR